ncbi:MAG TPA: hypothetical protein VJL31_12925 [Gemmatimonadales bacterium]|nr:hypothetical protein [Gemmatimonadales bacterium]
MTKRPAVVEPAAPEAELYDELEPEDAAEQAAIGTLFTIQGPEFEGIEWGIHRYLTRQEMAQNPSANKYEWVADVTGELHGGDLVAQVGGGTFRFFGHVPSADGKTKRLRHNRKITLAGPRKDFSWSPPPPPATAPAPNGPDPMLAQMLAAQQRQLDKIEMRLATPPAPAADPTAQMAAMLGLLKGVLDIVPKPAVITPPAPVDVMQMTKEVMNAINVGVNLRESLGGVGVEKSTAEIIVDKVMPAAERLLVAIATRRPSAARPAPVAVQAEVVTDRPAAQPAPPPPPTPATSEPEVDDGEARARMATLVGSMARAITGRTEPADFASSVEDILAPDELEIVRLMTAEQLMAEIAPAAGGRYPVLLTDQAKAYVAEVLTELNRAD